MGDSIKVMATMEILSWFLLEALAAAALFALFVWWTWPRARKDEAHKNAADDQPTP